MTFLLRRLGFYLLAAWVALTLNFIIPRLAPGDPASVLASKMQGQLSPEAMASLKAAYGIGDQPLIQQYFTYLGNMLRGDFGVSFSQFPATVTQVIGTAIGWSLLLGATSLILGYVIGSAIGVLAAWRRGGWFDRIVTPVLVFCGSFPYFFSALLMVYGLAVVLRWFPIGQSTSGTIVPGFSTGYVGDVAYHMVLPVASMVLIAIGPWALNMRNMMMGVLNDDYLTLAEAKGMPKRTVVWRATRNAMLPSITMLGTMAGALFGGQILTEVVFSYPGLGYMLLHAVTSLDYPLMQGLFLIITLAVLAANFIVDSTYLFLDPRVRAGATA